MQENGIFPNELAFTTWALSRQCKAGVPFMRRYGLLLNHGICDAQRPSSAQVAVKIDPHHRNLFHSSATFILPRKSDVRTQTLQNITEFDDQQQFVVVLKVEVYVELEMKFVKSRWMRHCNIRVNLEFRFFASRSQFWTYLCSYMNKKLGKGFCGGLLHIVIPSSTYSQTDEQNWLMQFVSFL